MNKLMSYLPKYYEDVVEIKHLTNAKIPEIENLWGNIEEVKNNQFIETMDSDRLRLWERLLRIRPDLSTQSLEYRKEVVLLRLNLTPPFTYRWLDELLLNRVGKDNYRIGLSHNKYSLIVHLISDDIGIITELRSFLRHTIPANMFLVVKQAQIKESDKIQIIKSTITKTANRHISHIKPRNIVVNQQSDKVLVVNTGITKTLNKHSATGVKRYPILLEAQIVKAGITKTVNSHGGVAKARNFVINQQSDKVLVVNGGLTKTGNKHSSTSEGRDLVINQESDKVSIINAGITKTGNKHCSIGIKKYPNLLEVKAVKAGITKTANSHSSLTKPRNFVRNQESDKALIINAGLTKTGNKHSGAGVKKDVDATKMHTFEKGTGKIFNKHRGGI